MEYAPENITVGMTTFNRWCYTKQTLETYLINTSPNTELIIIDNNSTDETKDKLEPYIKSCKNLGYNITLIKSAQNLGVGAAMNLAYASGSGDLLVKLDNDLIVPKNWLQYLWLMYRTFTSKLGAICLQIHDIKGKLDVPYKMSKGILYNIGGVSFEYTPVVNGATMCFTRKYWERHPFLNNRYYGYEDALLAKKAYDQGLICGQIRSTECSVLHLQNEEHFKAYEQWKKRIHDTAKRTGNWNYKNNEFCRPTQNGQAEGFRREDSKNK